MTATVMKQSPTLAPKTREATGIAAGTLVMTAMGESLVQDLTPGARIITREGIRTLTGLARSEISGKVVRISPSAIGHDRPATELVLGAAQQLYLRDWRAEALYGAPTAKVPALRLIDGEYISEIEVSDLPLYTLTFGAPCVVYAGGVELACGCV